MCGTGCRGGVLISPSAVGAGDMEYSQVLPSTLLFSPPELEPKAHATWREGAEAFWWWYPIVQPRETVLHT